MLLGQITEETKAPAAQSAPGRPSEGGAVAELQHCAGRRLGLAKFGGQTPVGGLQPGGEMKI